jgi:hypothetical protein
MSRFAPSRPLWRRTVTVAAFLFSMALFIQSAVAQEQTALKIRRTIKLDAVGNADIRLTLTAPTNVYTSLKTKTPNIAVLLRKLGAGRHWAFLENIDGTFNDMQSTVDIRYTQRGLARVEHGHRWSIPFEPGAALELIDIHDTTALYEENSTGHLGLTNLIVRLECPAGSTNLKNNPTERFFSYDFEPKTGEPGKVDATFAVEHKDSIMSCLAKCYSNERFSFLWAARSRFDNTGSATLSDYRVRFRIDGFTSWSQWQHTSKVYPGQTVVDPYYPVFELDKLNVLTGSRPVMLNIEYEYRRPDGEKFSESESRKLELLGCNETIFSGLAGSEVMNFSDRMEYLPPVLASFTTPSDPVIQELAGRMSGRAGGVGASFTNAEAIKFLRSLYDFMVENRISYQSPPTYMHGAQFRQHVKYGRDVLRNHAGTCIDLAILWASTCEAVGLHTVLIVIPGHCFPAVYLPEGQLFAVEATAIGKGDFDKAVEIGDKDLQQARQGESILADIPALRKSGIQSLDLPVIAPNFLTEAGYQFEPKHVQETFKYVDTNLDHRAPNRTSSASPVVGLWEYVGKLNGQNTDLGLSIRPNGEFCFVIIVKLVDGKDDQVKMFGQWRVDGNYLVLTDQTKATTRFQFWKDGNHLVLVLPGPKVTVHFLPVHT